MARPRSRGTAVGLSGLVLAIVGVAIFLLGNEPADQSGPGPAVRDAPEIRGRHRPPSREEAPTPEPPTETEDAVSLRVPGIVFGPEGARAGPGVRVSASAGPANREIAAVHTAPDGSFLLKLSGAVVEGTHPFQIAAAVEGLVSIPYVLRRSEAEAGATVFLRLVATGRLRARIVDAGGHAVPGGVLLIRGRSRFLPAPVHVDAHFSRWTMNLPADGEGVVDASVPPLRLRVWARRPQGVFGSSVTGEVRPGQVLDLGAIAVGEDLSLAVLHIENEHGEGIPDARVRVKFEHACHLAEIDRDIGTRFQYRSDAEGRVSLRFTRSRDPVLVGIGTPGYRVVAAALDRSSPRSEHTVVLRRIPGLTVRLVRPDGGPLPAELDVRVSTRPWFGSDRSPESWDVVLLGVQTPLHKPSRVEEHPSWLVATSLPHGQPCLGHAPGVFDLSMPRSGRVTVFLSLPMGVTLRTQAEADLTWPTTVLSLPPGRLARISMSNDASAAPQARALTPSERRKVWLLPRSEPEGAAYAPRSLADLDTVRRLGCRAPGKFDDPPFGKLVWLEAHYGGIEALGPLGPLGPRRSVPALGPLSEREIAAALDRLASALCSSGVTPVPPGRDAEVRIPWPRVPEALPLRKVTARVLHEGREFPVSNLDVVVRRERPREVRPTHWLLIGGFSGNREPTDDRGVATFYLPDGRYYGFLHARASPRKETVFEVSGADVEIQIHFVGA